MQKQLSELIEFALGKNITRIKDSDVDLYTPEDFETDLHKEEAHKDIGCVINLIKSKAAPLSEDTKGKFLTSNYLRCSYDREKLDAWYFCYQFNEGKEFEQQISMVHQGTTLSVKKLNVGTIGQLRIRLPEIKKQRIIGEIYRKSIIQNDLLLKQADDMKKMTFGIIKILEED